MTRDALRQSTRFKQAMSDLHLTALGGSSDYIPAAEAAAPAIRWLPFSPHGLVMAGSVLEDGTPVSAPLSTPAIANFTVLRVLNHFQDIAGQPLTALGLIAPGYPAHEWALSGPSVAFIGANQFSWTEAISHYEQALLADSPDERERHAEHMLVAVGCNLHLLQDQSSPAHTRNDMHPPHSVLLGTLTVALGSSLLEERGPRMVGVLSNPFLKGVSLAPERYATHREYFDNLVAFSNTGFFSDDTVLSSYPNPSLAAILSSTAGVCAAPAFLGERYLRGAAASYGSTDRLARERWIPKLNNLLHFGAYTLAGSSCDTFGLDSVVHDNLSLLVPAAIRHSAGLLDHFFRGRLTLAQEPGDVLRITNDSFLPPGAGWSGDFAPDPTAAGAFQVHLRAHMPDGLLRDVHTEYLSAPLARGQSVYVSNFGARMPVGSTGLVVGVLQNAWIGAEAGAAGGYVDWARCPELCSQQAEAWEVTPLQDCDGDLGSDFAIHRPFDGPSGVSAAGSLIAYSGSSCNRLWTRTGTHDLQFYGARVVPIGDRDGDGRSDLVVQEAYDASTKLYSMAGLSGRTGQPLFFFDLPQQDSGPLAALGYVDGDSVQDFAVLGVPTSIRSGATGQLLRTIALASNDSVSVAADWDGDGARDILAERTLAPGIHQFLVYSSATTAVAAASSPSMQSYQGFVSLDDADGDGVPDFVGVQSPTAVLFSGLDGSVIRSFPGAADQAGSAGDFDGDGYADFVLRRLINDPSLGSVWSIEVRSAASAPLLSYVEPNLVAGLPMDFGDLDADGASDLGYVYIDTQNSGSTCLKFLRGNSAP